MTEEILLQFAKAWQEKNLEEVISFFTHDCHYFSSVGMEPGTSFLGRTEVRKGIQEMMSHDMVKDVSLSNVKIDGDFGFWEWTYFLKNGKIELGCDVFEFQNNKIKSKNAFRKVLLND